MSLYTAGLVGGAIVVPEHPQVQRVRQIAQGFGMIRDGEPRFYQRGLHPTSTRIGAATGGPVGGLLDSLVGLILDLAHVLLILGGMYLLWTGLRAGF